MRALPRVCHAQKFIHQQLRVPIVPEDERRLWAQKLGEKDYSSFHHFCWALIFMRRGNTADARQRKHNYQAAVQNFVYVQRNASAAFPMMPEVNLRKGLSLRLLGDEGAAAKEFVGAIQLKSDYSPAYAALVDLYRDLGDLESAGETLELGLKHAPGSKILGKKKQELEAQSGSR